MFSNKVRIALIVGCAGLGVWKLSEGRTISAVMLFIAAAVWIYTYFRYGSVWLALYYAKRGDIERANC